MLHTILDAIEFVLQIEGEPQSAYWLASQMHEMRLWKATERKVQTALEQDAQLWGDKTQFIKTANGDWALREWEIGKSMKRKQPKTTGMWLIEIQQAMEHAAEEPFDCLLNDPDKAVNLHHLAPIICLNFRGLNDRDEALREKVTKGALANFIVNSSPEGIDHGLESRPLLAFAVCYVTAHYVLDLVEDREVKRILNRCDEEWD